MGTVEPGGIQAANGVFGEELKAQRTKRGWTQVELGRKLDRYSDSHISDIERGAKPPTLGFARKCDKLFDLPGTFGAAVRDRQASRGVPGLVRAGRRGGDPGKLNFLLRPPMLGARRGDGEDAWRA